MKLSDCKIIQLKKYLDARGNLSVIEGEKDIPFKIERTYWIYDVPGGETRDGHVFCRNDEFIVALSGSFDVVLDDGIDKKTYSLNRSYYGLYIPHGIWRALTNFSTNAVALELGSIPYNPLDYVMEYTDFQKMKANGEI